MFFIVVTHVISVDSWDNLKMSKAQFLNETMLYNSVARIYSTNTYLNICHH